MLKRLIVIVPLIFLFIACSIDRNLTLQEAVQTLTATAWTPDPLTATATPELVTGGIVDGINDVLRGADPLAETIGARFRVSDVLVISESSNYLSNILYIRMDCEWVYTDSCTPEEAFITLMNAFKTSDKIKQSLSAKVPPTVTKLQVASYNQMHAEGMIVVSWKDVYDYMQGNINGNQLGIRISRTPLP